MKTNVAGIYYYLYTIIDLWSRKIVGWCISDIESYTVSEQLFTLTMNRLNLKSVHLHSAIGYVTPEQRYTGEAVSIIAKRNAVKKAAFEAKRVRWSKQFTPLKNPEVVYLNKLPDVYAKVS
ncbi:MAG: hypothetical protein WCR31_07335 [Treponema sp.]